MPYRVALVGAGRMGQGYLDVYTGFANCELVALVEPNAERAAAVAQRFGVGAHFATTEEMLEVAQPEIVCVVTPVRYMHAAVMACAACRSVRAIQCDKPIGAVLSEVDEMLAACDARKILFAGGNLQRALSPLQEVAAGLRRGDYGEITGCMVHSMGNGEISGGGCQHISVLRLLTGQEITSIVAIRKGKKQSPPPLPSGEPLPTPNDHVGHFAGQFTMRDGLVVPFFPPTNHDSGEERVDSCGIDIWTEDHRISWDWGTPRIWKKTAEGQPPTYTELQPAFRPHGSYLESSSRSMLDALDALVANNNHEQALSATDHAAAAQAAAEASLYVSARDLRQALEAAIAINLSADSGGAAVALPLVDRSATAASLYPGTYRWMGGDVSGRPQSAAEAAGMGAPKL